MTQQIIVTKLKKIEVEKGNIFHAIKASDKGFNGFGEAYFSSVLYGVVKAWKRHKRMTMNLIVPIGMVRFVFCGQTVESRGRFSEITIGEDNYARLTIAPGTWFGFQGKADGLNLVLNIADMEHDPLESEQVDMGQIPFDWSTDRGREIG